VFRTHGATAYDLRILSWNLSSQAVSIWTVKGRRKLGFIGAQSQVELLQLPRGQSDLIYRDGSWYLLTTVEVSPAQMLEAKDYLGVDLDIVAIAHTSDGVRFAGGHLNGLRIRHKMRLDLFRVTGTQAPTFWTTLTTVSGLLRLHPHRFTAHTCIGRRSPVHSRLKEFVRYRTPA